MMDIKVFVDADADERLIRVIHRDCIERGRTPQMVIDRYQETLKPMHELHIEPTKRYADLIVPQGEQQSGNKAALQIISALCFLHPTTHSKRNEDFSAFPRP